MNVATLANIPEELRLLPRFALWRREPRFEGEAPTKVPYSPRYLGRAKSNDSTTWATFDECVAVLERRPGRFAGLGFMLGDDAPYVGVDLDDSLDSAGQLLPRPRTIVDRFSTYTEVSQSGRGVKMIGRGTMPTPDGKGKHYKKNPWGTGRGAIEFYRRARFFALTGRHVPRTPRTVEDCTAPLDALYRQLYPPAPPRPAAFPIGKAGDADVRRASAYLAKLPPSISGAGGHNALLHAACTLIRFGLDDSDALSLLHDYNRRADPPWPDSELERKLREARKVAGHETGVMLLDRTDCHRPHEPMRFRRVVAVVEGGAR